MKSTISLITPSFNQSAFVKEMLDSVAKQTVQPIEHLILDGGSTDGTLEILQAYQQDRPHVRLDIGRDSGQTNAINLGFSDATGDILTWLNTDDFYIDQNIFSEVTDFFDENPEIDILYGRGEFISVGGEKLKDVYINRDDKDLKNKFITSLGILQPALFMRRNVFEDAGPLDESMSFSFDYEYWVRALFANKTFRFWDRNVCKATIHNDAKTIRARSTSLNDCVDVCKKYYGFAALEWVDRVTNNALSGADGIFNYEAERSESYLAHRDKLFRQFNGSKANIEKALSAAHLGESQATIEYIRSSFGLDLSKVIVTTFDPHYFEQGLTMIAGAQRYHAATIPILVYSLGLDVQQIDLLSSLKNVFVLEYPKKDFDFFPQYFDAKSYGYKCLVMWHAQHVVGKDGLILWIDAGVCPLQPLDSCFEKIANENVFFIDHDDKNIPYILNITCTSDECIRLLNATNDELLDTHLRSSFMGYRAGGPYQELFDEAFALSRSPNACMADKNPKPPIYRLADPRYEGERNQALNNAEVRNAFAVEMLRDIFPYYGHTKDQPVFSILASRYMAPISSAKHFCLSCDESSEASQKNWESGGAATDIKKSSQVPAFYLGCDAIAMQHRGIYVNHIGLRFESISANRPAIILGNGPSLRGFDFSRLSNFDVFGMNAAYRYWDEINWYPQFYSCLDTVVGMSHDAEIKRLIETSDETGIQLFLLRENLVNALGACRHKDKVVNFDELRDNINALQVDPITTGSHTAAWAAVLGYRSIYLLGVDCNYREVVSGAQQREGYELEIVEDGDNPNYFFDGYQKKGDAYNLPNPFKDLHLRSWRNVAKSLIGSDVTVLNANLDSKVDCFDFCLFESVEQTGHIETIDPYFVLNSEEKPASEIDECGRLRFTDPACPHDITIGVPSVAKAANAKLDEFRLAWNLIREKADNGILVDVGAHMGSGPLESIVKSKWDVYAFEPDPKNRAALTSKFADHKNIVISDEAVSNSIETDVDFFSSDVSTGISGLTAFHESHEKSATVSTTTLDAIIKRHELDHIDLLKIDVEGHEMSVLQGLDFDKLKPRLVVAEFEDSKTKLHGYDSRDLANFFVRHGYKVFASEWHPIEQYGANHSWRCFKSYPCEIQTTSWGNFIAVLDAVDDGAISDYLKDTIQYTSLKPQPEPAPAASQSKPGLERAPKQSEAQTEAVDPNAVSADDGIYASTAKRLRARSPALFHLLRFPVFCLKQLKRRPLLGLIAISLLLLPLAVIWQGNLGINLITQVLISLTMLFGATTIAAMGYLFQLMNRRLEERQNALEEEVRGLRRNHDTRLVSIRTDLENNVSRIDSSKRDELKRVYHGLSELSESVANLKEKIEDINKG